MISDWKNAVVVPVPKKGDLKCCDNWRGISLLDVVGKLFARIIQERLQSLAEKVLAESQCGFRKGRGCSDMIFVARQLLEKSREHQSSLFTLFVDLKKAYDSVPRDALWQVLEKCGVPPKMLTIVKQLHEGMQAEVRIGSELSDSFEVKNGLRQGCTLAPTLFNLFFSAVVKCWQVSCPEAGVDVLFSHGRKLVGDRTAKSRLSSVRITESQFADDVALYTSSRTVLESAALKFVENASLWGLTVSVEKTKAMASGMGLNASDLAPLQVGSGQFEMVDNFTYLGSVLSSDCEILDDVTTRIAKASKVFGSLRGPIFRNPVLSIATKRAVYKAVVLSVLLYGGETWTPKALHIRRLSSFHNRCVRSILGVSRFQQWTQKLSSNTLAQRLGMEWSIAELLAEKRLRWLGHLGRMKKERLPKIMLFGELKGKRPAHGTRKRWRDQVMKDMRGVKVLDNWYERCQERKEWFELCKEGIGEMASLRKNTCAANGQPQVRTFICDCGRSFRRQGDLTRHSRFCVLYSP